MIEKGNIVVSKKNCPYACRGGRYRVSKIISTDLMDLFIVEHKSQPGQVGRMFKARPEFFEIEGEEEESFGKKMANMRKGKKFKEDKDE